MSADCDFGHQIISSGKEETRNAIRIILKECLGIPKMAIYVVHLEDRNEEKRVNQVKKLQEWIDSSEGKLPHIIVGDFNALTRADYTDEYFAKIDSTRKKYKVEDASFEVTDILKSNYIDIFKVCHSNVKDVDLATSHYGTRVDYIWLSKDFSELVNTDLFIGSQETASDHKPITVIINRK